MFSRTSQIKTTFLFGFDKNLCNLWQPMFMIITDVLRNILAVLGCLRLKGLSKLASPNASR